MDLASQLLKTHSKSVHDSLTATLRCNVHDVMDRWMDGLTQAKSKFQKELREAQTEFDHYVRKTTQLHQEMEAEVQFPLSITWEPVVVGVRSNAISSPSFLPFPTWEHIVVGVCSNAISSLLSFLSQGSKLANKKSNLDSATLQKMQDALRKTQERVARNGEKMAQANTHLNTLNKDRISLLLVEMENLPEHLVPVFRQVPNLYVGLVPG